MLREFNIIRKTKMKAKKKLREKDTIVFVQ